MGRWIEMDEFTYTDRAKHSTNVLDGLDEQRKNNPRLCDFIIEIENAKFHCHRSILSLFSKYFRAIFEGQFQESKTNFIKIQNISSRYFGNILDFVYSGKITINQDNVQELLKTAQILQFENVSTLCTNYLRHQIDESNVLCVMRFAKEGGYVELQETTEDFIFDRLLLVFESDVALTDATFDDLSEILSNPLAHSREEESVVLVMLRWLQHDITKRKCYASELLKFVEWPRISVDFVLRKLLQHQLVKEDEVIKRLIIDHVKEATESLGRSDNTESVDEGEERSKRRLSHHHKSRDITAPLGGRRSPGECLLLIGGLTLGEAEHGDISQPNVMSYNPRTKTWKERSRWAERGLRGFAVTKFQNGAVVTGGCYFEDSVKRLNKRAWMYVVESDDWRQLPDMICGRAFHSSCSLPGEVYVLGGSTKNTLDMETYTLHANTWTLPESHVPKYVTNYTLTPCNGKILLLGCGSRSCSLILQIYNPSTSQWTVFRSPNVPRHLSTPVSATCRSSDLIAVCGDNSKKVFIFNPNENSWLRGADMQNMHSNGDATSIGDDVYLTGGHWEGESYWDEMESYNVKSDTWTSKGPLPHLWLYHGCASVYYAE